MKKNLSSFLFCTFTNVVQYGAKAFFSSRPILVFLFITGTSHFSSAQLYQWAKSVGGTGADNAYSMAVDGSGNVYITGSFSGTADFYPGAGTVNLTSAGDVDIFFAKYDVNGNYLWAKKIGGTGADNGKDIAVDGSGNVYIIGTFQTTADFDPGSGTANLTVSVNTDLFFAKYDNNGNYLWAQKIGAGANNYGNSLVLDGSGNIYITGMFTGTADFDPGPGTANLNASTGGYIFFAKYNSSGNYIWAKNIGGAFNGEQARSIAVDGSGNVYITGSFNGTSDFDPGVSTVSVTSSGNDLFFAKYDVSGNYVWAKTLGGTGTDISYSITVDGTGGVYITGRFEDLVDFDPGAGTANLISLGYADIFFAKYSTGGNYLWAKRIGSSVNNDTGNSIFLDGSNNVYITGNFDGTADFDPGVGTANLTSAGSYDIFFASYDAGGNYLSAKRIGNNSIDIGYDIALDGSGNLYITGGFNGTTDFDPGAGTANLVSNGVSDIFFAKYCTLSAVATATPISCNGINDGKATVNASQGTPPYSYLWSNGQTTSTATGLGVAVYSVTVTESLGCAVNASVSTTQPLALTLSVSTTPTNCSSNTGTATITVGGGVSPYSYLWSNGQTASVATALNSGSYTLTVTDTNGCTKTETPVITVKPSPNITITTNQNVSCNGLSNGSLTANHSGGTSPYTFLWTGGKTTQTVTGFSVGDYTVTVTDANGCTGISTKNITEPPILTVTASVVAHASCGKSDGRASVAPATGGTPSYSYLWSTGSIAQNISNLSGGTYTITVTDSKGCTVADTVLINNFVPLGAMVICAVTVDSLSLYNLIVWDKTPLVNLADTFLVYRDTANNAYGLIGKIPYDSLSQFIDTARTLYAANGDPNASTWKYKIAVVDTCGNISQMSPYHKSLFIQNNNGNFSWNDYQVEGQPVPVPALSNYLFQRDDLSTGNWVTIQTLSASSLAYTDAAYSVYQSTGSWRVQTSWSIECTPTIKNPNPFATSVKSSKSNSSDKIIAPGSVAALSLNNLMKVSPNPSKGTFTLEIVNGNTSTINKQGSIINVYNVYGELVHRKELNGQKTEITIPGIPNGVYQIRIITNSGIVNGRIVVSR